MDERELGYNYGEKVKKKYIEHIVDDVEEKSVQCEMFEVENDLNNGHDTTNKVYEVYVISDDDDDD